MTASSPTLDSHASASDGARDGSEQEWEYLDRGGDGSGHDEDDDVDDDDETEESTMDALRTAWRQHAGAVLVALLATAVFAYHRPVRGPAAAAPPQEFLFSRRHTHLEGFRRTSDITFCGDVHGAASASASGNATLTFEFTFPKSLVPAVVLHYAADSRQDDDYSQVIEMDAAASEPWASVDPHPELSCLKAQQMDAASVNVRGYSRYYPAPTIDSMYPDAASSTSLSVLRTTRLQPAHLTFSGFAAKFFNLSPEPVLLFWDGRGETERRLVGEIAPFEALGTATTPGQSFSVAPVFDPARALARWTATPDESLLYYDPQERALSDAETMLYQLQLLNKEFAKHYQIYARRPWLAQFPRPFPRYFMWPATHFGQVQPVPGSSLELTTESVEPRVFSVKNFLSHEECDELLRLALSYEMLESTVYSGSLVRHQRDMSTRSSTNTWLERSASNLTNHVYEKAAKLLRIEESVMQASIDDDVHAHYHSIAESLQVVRYKEGEEYMAHHDFVYPPQRHRMQPTRFATLLMYLNDDFEGGQTRFPRATNAHFHDGIAIEPKKGTAILFYNVLPDGNVDDLSQHSGEPVTTGEKYIANLWVWEPVIN